MTAPAARARLYAQKRAWQAKRKAETALMAAKGWRWSTWLGMWEPDWKRKGQGR